MARRLTPRGQERRRQLIEHATRCFAANGYHTTSVSEIVEGVGVGKGVFYWYFESKDQLLEAILTDAQRDLRRCQQRAIEGVDDPVRRIELGIRASLEWTAAHRDVNRLIQFAATEERFVDVVRAGARVSLQDTARHVVEAMELGLIRDGDAELVAQAVLGVITSLARHEVLTGRRSAGEVADAAVSFCLEGLGATAVRAPG